MNKIKYALAAFCAVGGIALPASAKLKLETKPEPIFILMDSGQQVSATDAMKASIADKAVLKCEQVEFTAKATGSGSFKKKK